MFFFLCLFVCFNFLGRKSCFAVRSEGNVSKSRHRAEDVLISPVFSDGLDFHSKPSGLTFGIHSACSENCCSRKGLRKKWNLLERRCSFIVTSEADGDLVGDARSEMGCVCRETNVSTFEGYTLEIWFFGLLAAYRSVKLSRAW